MEILKLLKEWSAYKLDGNCNYTHEDMVEFALKYHNEQLPLLGVAVTLPKSGDAFLKIYRRFKNRKNEIEPTESEDFVKGYKNGFIDCYNWIKNNGN